MNFICEERALKFEQDIFNFHELVFMRPIYKDSYLFTIFSANRWIERYGAYVPTAFGDQPDYKRERLWVFLNDMAFLCQLIFMTINGSKPEYERLIDNHDKGRIEFYPSDFKKGVMEKFKADSDQ
jgi:hypothetical protein